MGTATGEAPAVKTIAVRSLAAAAAVDADAPLWVAEFAGSLTSAQYIPVATLTGANTDSRTLRVINKGAAGSGSTVMASKAFTSGVNATAFVPTTITNSGTAANLDFAAGDVLDFNSLHVGATGLADPGGTIVITVSRD